MSENKLWFYPKIGRSGEADTTESQPLVEPATCVEAEPFVLRVLDKSMEPEFRKGCMIVVDPTGRASDGSYVIARPRQDAEDTRNHATASTSDTDESALDEIVFRQLYRDEDGNWGLRALSVGYPAVMLQSDLSEVMGVIVQRAGVRRAYHKRYD